MYIGLSSYFAINFRSRESTLKELIQLCWNTGDQSGEYDDRMSGVADILFSTPGKRVGSLLQHQARTNSILKSAISQSQNQQQKRNLAKLKKILLSCLLSKNILEPKDIKVKKHFLRFGWSYWFFNHLNWILRMV